MTGMLERLPKEQGLVTVMGLCTASLSRMIAALEIGEQFVHETEPFTDFTLSINPMRAESQRVGEEGGLK
jgi:hypothetical protein